MPGSPRQPAHHLHSSRHNKPLRPPLAAQSVKPVFEDGVRTFQVQLCTKVCIWRIGVGAKSLVRAQLCLNGLLDVVPFYECSSIFTEVFNFFHAQEEGTPAVFSTRTSLSGLTMDDDIPVSIISIFS